MRITADCLITDFEKIKDSLPQDTFETFTKQELAQKVANKLLEMNSLLSEERPEDMAATWYRFEAIVLSKENFREILKILRDHSGLNDYWKEQIKYLFTDKP